MPHNLIIVAILTIGFALASFLGYLMQRIQLPLILGYLLAGYIIGPYSPGFVANPAIAEQLAEIGVILMLFGVGLHFKLEDLWRVKNIAIPGAVLQTLAATVFATLIVYNIGWGFKTGLIIGLAVGVASTVVLVRQLIENNILNSLKGHIAVGWLVVEDIFTVAILILLPTLADISFGHEVSWIHVTGEIFFVIGKFSTLVLFMFTFGHKCIEYILKNVARLRSQELFTLTVLALVFLIATGSAVIFGTSIALGAFIAGMVVGKTNVRHQAAANALPLKDIFSVIFFISVGMLFNPNAIIEHLTLFLGIIFVILIIKPLSAYLITVFLGYPVNVALTVAIALAQIGEFSFILAEEAMNLKILPDEGFDILVACALVSISLNPLLFKTIHFLETWILKKEPRELVQHVRKQFCALPQKVLVVGFGPVGKAASTTLKQLNLVPQIIEENIDTVSLQEAKNAIIFGDASEANILKSAHIEEAGHLLITVPNLEKAIKIIHAARHANPNIKIAARAQYISEKVLFDELNVECICTEDEAVQAFTNLVRKLFKAK